MGMVGAAGPAIVGVCAVVFLGILAGLLLHRIIGWYISGDISSLQCAIIGGVYIGVLITITVSPFAAVKVALALIIVLSCILGPVVGRRVIYKRELHRFHDDEIEKYRQVIASRPDNWAARSRLADELFKRGLLDEAVEEQSELVRLRPQDVEEARKLKSLIGEREEHKAPPRVCPSCGRSNPPERSVCLYCERQLSLAKETARWFTQEGAKQMRVPFAIGMAIAVPALLLFSALSALGRILFIALTLLVGLIALLVRMNMRD